MFGSRGGIRDEKIREDMEKRANLTLGISVHTTVKNINSNINYIISVVWNAITINASSTRLPGLDARPPITYSQPLDQEMFPLALIVLNCSG